MIPVKQNGKNHIVQETIETKIPNENGNATREKIKTTLKICRDTNIVERNPEIILNISKNKKSQKKTEQSLITKNRI